MSKELNNVNNHGVGADTTVRDFNKSTTQALNICSQIIKTTDKSTLVKDVIPKVELIQEHLEELSIPQPKCASCAYFNKKVSSTGFEFSCFMKLMPPKVIKSANHKKSQKFNIHNFGCTEHSDF